MRRIGRSSLQFVDAAFADSLFSLGGLRYYGRGRPDVQWDTIDKDGNPDGKTRLSKVIFAEIRGQEGRVHVRRITKAIQLEV